MGDGLKLSKDKRHRSSSSLAGVIEGTRSERKLDIRASIPEVDDQFAVAEARCEDLQEKIDMVKVLKRKKKLKRRSMTRVAETPPPGESIPFISVHTQPKKKMSQQAVRLRRLEVPPNPTRGYLDPATVEQHRMIGQVRGYNQGYQPLPERNRQKHGTFIEPHSSPRLRMRRTRADGDAMTSYERPAEQAVSSGPLEVACGDDNALEDFSDNDVFDDRQYTNSPQPKVTSAAAVRRRHVPREVPTREVHKKTNQEDVGQPRRSTNQRPAKKAPPITAEKKEEERPVVELFNKATSRGYHQTAAAISQSKSPDKVAHMKNSISPEAFPHKLEDETGPLWDTPSGTKKDAHRHRRCVKYRSRRYEQPTVASQMKQAGARYCYDAGYISNIPFVVSKSTAPSHNIGVNIQQVLNGIKIQQPLSGIPSTMAHHMGLGHVPMSGTSSAVMQPTLDNGEMNVIRLGKRLLRLPSYRYMSYRRLLSLYREGDGMVPRFLRSISRPHYFYTSMYNLATNREDADGATSKGRGSQEAKQSLAEYAGLYREYEHVENCLKNEYQPELERRKEELSRELAMREEHIRRVVQEYRSDMDQNNLRASASTADDAYRHSTFKLNSDDRQ